MSYDNNTTVFTESIQTETPKDVTTSAAAATTTPAKKAKRKTLIWKDIIDFILMALVVMSICRFVFMFLYIPSRSMEPTIAGNSFSVSWRLPFLVGNPKPNYGDIVVFQSEESHEYLIKRVIGLPGDVITFDDGYVFRNGDVLDEEYLAEQGVTKHGNQEKYIVPDGCMFVLGDNRENSVDSRYVENPYIPIKNTISKMLISFPIPIIET